MWPSTAPTPCGCWANITGGPDNPEKALKWWRKSIRAGRHLGARLELARTYFEVGRRLSNREHPSATLDGLEAPTYLKLAGELFEDMGLAWDLDRLSRVERR